MIRMRFRIATLAILFVTTAWSLGRAENVDPDTNGSRYAYGENVGWLNAVVANDNGDVGIDAYVSLVDHCIARGNGGDGIRNANGLVLHSLATGNDEDGIDATNSIIQSNSATSNTGVDIDPDANSTIIENNE